MLIFDAAAAAATTLVLLISIIPPSFSLSLSSSTVSCVLFLLSLKKNGTKLRPIYSPLIESCVGLLLSLLVADGRIE
jgi:hypothetical protein